MTELALLFVLVFILNVIPAFAPPTWMAMSMLGFASPDLHPWLVAVVAATAATSGRVVLAHLAQRIVRSRWVHGAVQQNLAAVAGVIRRRRAASSVAFLAFAFSPLPSNFLFIAYGLTGSPLWLLATPFFIGRAISYGVAFEGGSMAFHHFGADVGGVWVGVYFAVTQLLMLGGLALFAKIDWRASIATRRLRWLREPVWRSGRDHDGVEVVVAADAPKQPRKDPK